MTKLYAALVSILLLCTGCGKSLEEQIRDQARTVDGAEWDKESVEILEIRETGSQAIAEIRVQTAVRMEKRDGKWKMEEIRLADRRWEKIDRILQVLEESRRADTRDRLELVAGAVRAYRDRNGELPAARDYIELIDQLNPRYLEEVVRLDGWQTALRYRVEEGSRWELRSAGPDREFETEDDLRATP